MHNKENIVEYEGLGKVLYIRSQRARRLAIRISQQGEVKVTIPRGAGKGEAERFLLSRREWVLAKKRQLAEQKKQGVKLASGNVEIKGRNIELKPDEKGVEEALWKVLLPEAKVFLPGRTLELAREHGIRITGVKVRRMYTRWGSCTAKNGINLNSWLLMLPDHLSDYVILHELAHTRQKNHGPRFWKLLDEMTGGDSLQLRRELSMHRIMLINPED